jgi:hypothetical protein
VKLRSPTTLASRAGAAWVRCRWRQYCEKRQADGRRAEAPGKGPVANSEEEVALVGFSFCPTVSSEAHFLGIVGTELVTKELTIWSTPRLELSVHDRQTFSTKSATRRRVGSLEAFGHMLSLTFPHQKRRPHCFGCNTRVLLCWLLQK